MNRAAHCLLSPRVLGVCLFNLVVGLAGGAVAGAQRAAPQSVPVAVNARMGLNEWEMPFFLRNADVITGTGVGSIRVALLWQQVEPQPDVYTWDKLDRVVGQAQGAQPACTS